MGHPAGPWIRPNPSPPPVLWEIDDAREAGGVLLTLAGIQARTDGPEVAARTASRAVALARERGMRDVECRASMELGDWLLATGAADDARVAWLRAEELAGQVDRPRMLSEARKRLGR